MAMSSQDQERELQDMKRRGIRRVVANHAQTQDTTPPPAGAALMSNTAPNVNVRPGTGGSGGFRYANGMTDAQAMEAYQQINKPKPTPTPASTTPQVMGDIRLRDDRPAPKPVSIFDDPNEIRRMQEHFKPKPAPAIAQAVGASALGSVSGSTPTADPDSFTPAAPRSIYPLSNGMTLQQFEDEARRMSRPSLDGAYRQAVTPSSPGADAYAARLDADHQLQSLLRKTNMRGTGYSQDRINAAQDIADTRYRATLADVAGKPVAPVNVDRLRGDYFETERQMLALPFNDPKRAEMRHTLSRIGNEIAAANRQQGTTDQYTRVAGTQLQGDRARAAGEVLAQSTDLANIAGNEARGNVARFQGDPERLARAGALDERGTLAKVLGAEAEAGAKQFANNPARLQDMYNLNLRLETAKTEREAAEARSAIVKAGFDSDTELQSKIKEVQLATANEKLREIEQKKMLALTGGGVTPEAAQAKLDRDTATLSYFGINKDTQAKAQAAVQELHNAMSAFSNGQLVGNYWGGASKPKEAARTLLDYSLTLARMEKTNPQLAREYARDLFNTLPETDASGGYNANPNYSGALAAGLTGAGTGAAGGAIGGSVIPGLGTAVGAVGGAVSGGILGLIRAATGATPGNEGARSTAAKEMTTALTLLKSMRDKLENQGTTPGTNVNQYVTEASGRLQTGG